MLSLRSMDTTISMPLARIRCLPSPHCGRAKARIKTINASQRSSHNRRPAFCGAIFCRRRTRVSEEYTTAGGLPVAPLSQPASGSSRSSHSQTGSAKVKVSIS